MTRRPTALLTGCGRPHCFAARLVAIYSLAVRLRQSLRTVHTGIGPFRPRRPLGLAVHLDPAVRVSCRRRFGLSAGVGGRHRGTIRPDPRIGRSSLSPRAVKWHRTLLPEALELLPGESEASVPRRGNWMRLRLLRRQRKTCSCSSSHIYLVYAAARNFAVEDDPSTAGMDWLRGWGRTGNSGD